MRPIVLLLAAVPLLAACQRQSEVRGLYVNNGTTGYLFACGAHRNPLYVPDSALAAAYRSKSLAPGQLMYVRLRAVLADSGSVYGGMRYVLRPKVLEMRAPRTGDCPAMDTRVIPAGPPAGAPPS